MRDAKNDIHNIQALRFIAAFMVVCCHSTFYTRERLSDDIALFSRGANGVPLFFAISGFVMILASEKLKGVKEGWKTFAIKRITRIVPLYWLITICKIVIMLFTTNVVLHSSIDVANVVKSFLFIPAYNADGRIEPILGVGWTLNFEMFFYLIFTISLLLRMNRILFSGIILSLLSLLAIFKTPEWPVWIKFYTNPIAINFLFGMIAAYLLNKNFIVPKKASIIMVTAGLLFLFLPLPTFFITSNFYLKALFNALASFLVVYSAASLEKQLKLSFPKFVLFFGAASYSLYLIHPVIAPLSPTVLKHFGMIYPFISVLFSILLSLAAAAFFYQNFETKIAKFFNEFMSKSKALPKKRSTYTTNRASLPQ